MLRKVALLNTRLGLIIPYVGFAIPLAINILTNFFKTIPTELEESAFMDGASIYRTFFSIMLPLVKPAISTVAIFTYISSWNELMFATSFVNKQAIRTLTVGIMSMVGQYVTRWGPIGAGLVIATVPSVIGYSLVSTQLPKSISAGAVKG
jgi:raffinose/stachyose/melibiose transport system permease protein